MHRASFIYLVTGLPNSMPQRIKIFRVFVSSTFTDMIEERRILQQKVFPKLEKHCELNGAKFQAVDLRWGVNEETQLNQKTLEICLGEIARCQKISSRLNFIILLGNKYGWQPVPAKIPGAEMRQIQKSLTGDEKRFIDKWYWMDENAIPAEYVLQPREKEHGTYAAWATVEAGIRIILRKAVESSTLTTNEKEKYFSSATHQEITCGTIKPHKEGKTPGEHVYAFVKKINGLPGDISAQGFIDWDEDDEQRRHCISRLESLQSELKLTLGNHYIPYTASWDNGKSAIDNPEEFAEKAYSLLEAIINNQLNFTPGNSEIEHEVGLHKEFKERLTTYFLGREEILEKIQHYINNHSAKNVLSIIGNYGSGKSSVIAQAIKHNESSKAFIAYRFIGITSPSSTTASLLLSLCGQIAKEFDVPLEKLAGSHNGKIAQSIHDLAEVFKKCLALATEEKPVVVFLDAPDQLPEPINAGSLYWIPQQLPDNARVIVSCASTFKQYLPSTVTEYLPALPRTEARQILDRWFLDAGRKLTGDQYKVVMDNFSKTGLPLYLKLAFERSKQWHSYDKNPALNEDIKGIINDYFDLLEKEHTKDLVKNITCYMLCGRYQGLAENELLEILFFDSEYRKTLLDSTYEEYRNELDTATKIPVILWSRLFLDMEPFLAERDADGVPVISFFHTQFIEVLKERYGLTENNSQMQLHVT